MLPKSIYSTVYLLSFIVIIVVLITGSQANAVIITYTPRISISVDFTDNIYLSGETDRETDLITAVSPGLTTVIEKRDIGMSFSYFPTASYYSKHRENNMLRHRVQASGWAVLSNNTRLNLQDTFVRTEEPFGYIADDTESEILEGDTDVRENRLPYNKNTAEIGITHRFNAENSMALEYVYQDLINDDPEIAEDNKTHTPSVNLVYWFVPNSWGIEIGSSYTRRIYEGLSDDFTNWHGDFRIVRRFTRRLEGTIQYDHIQMVYDGDTENYKVYDSSIGMNYGLPSNAAFELGVGYFVQDREESEDVANFTIEGDLGKTWRFNHGDMNISGSSGYDESLSDNENSGFSIFYGANWSIDYIFSRKVVSDISCSARRNRYINSEPDELEREDLSAIIATRLTWRLEPWMSARVGLSFRNLDSNIDENDYKEKRAFINVNIAPSPPFRIVP